MAAPAPSASASAERAALIARLRDLAASSGKTNVTQAEFGRATGISDTRLRRHFSNWGALVRAAGMTPYRGNFRLADDALMQAMRGVFLARLAAEGSLPNSFEFERIGPHNLTTYRKRWGNWTGTLAAFAAWLAAREPASPLLPLLAAGRKRPARPEPRALLDAGRYGRKLPLASMLHGPVNEQGTVFLFAALAGELGFMIEAIGAGFPDCVAKQRLPGGEEWRRLRIEFEYRSRNFAAHRHDPAGCDLIVCWTHDWPDCPLEVLELRELVASAV